MIEINCHNSTFAIMCLISFFWLSTSIIPTSREGSRALLELIFIMCDLLLLIYSFFEISQQEIVAPLGF
jgi:hypothetical protein